MSQCLHQKQLGKSILIGQRSSKGFIFQSSQILALQTDWRFYSYRISQLHKALILCCEAALRIDWQNWFIQRDPVLICWIRTSYKSCNSSVYHSQINGLAERTVHLEGLWRHSRVTYTILISLWNDNLKQTKLTAAYLLFYFWKETKSVSIEDENR